jgi:thiosulfate dehydrogenase [quinone] large subunit
MNTKITNSFLAYSGLRLAFGLSLLVHGAIRFPKWAGFAEGMAAQFDGTLLAGFPALGFAYFIPLAEALIGLSLLVGGRFIRWGAFAGCLLMGGIMFGTGMLEKWELLASQLIHLALFYAILMHPLTPDSSAD